MTIWQYDEFQQVGTDYSETAEVEKYDSRHSDFRDMDADCIQALDKIDHARAKAKNAGVTNIHFHRAGFLTYEHEGSPVDIISTTFTFHHLPDFWKGIALKRIHAMLKPGGRFCMHDVILKEDNAIDNISALITKLSKLGGKQLQEDTEKHFKEEFSTYDWVMDGLLTRSGLSIKSKHIAEGVLGTYICTKEEECYGI